MKEMRSHIKTAIILSLLVLMGIGTAKSQDDIRPRLGIRVGLDIDCPTKYNFKDGTGVSLFGAGAGFSVTGVYNLPISYSNFYFEPGVTLYYNTLSMDVELLEGETSVPEPAGMSTRLFGFRLPFVFGYALPLEKVKVHLFAGPVLQIGLVARQHISMKYSDINLGGSTNAYGDDGLLDRFDCGIRIGAGVEQNNWIFQFYGTIGTCDQASSKYAKMRTSQIVIGLGYNF